MIEIRKGGTLRTTWEELKTSIKNNTSSLNIGDELDIVLKTGENVTLVCEYVGYKYATFFTKNLLEDTHCMNENWAADNEKCLSTMGSYLSKLFYLLPDDLQKVVAGSLRLLHEREVFGKDEYREEEGHDWLHLLPRYLKKENRIKTLSGIPFPYWLSPTNLDDPEIFPIVGRGGDKSEYSVSDSCGVCFGFDI